MLTMPADAAAPEEPDAAAQYDSDGDGVADRPDLVSATLLAEQLGVRVEDMSARTEAATTVVEPDGMLTLEDFGGPVRVQRDVIDPATGEATPSWVDVDYTLQEIDGDRWSPKAAPAEVVVGGSWRSQPEAVRVEIADGAGLAVTWPGGALGEPTVEGGVATYAISESMDLVVAMTTAGASTWVRINDELTEAETAAIEARGVTFGLRTTGGTELVTTDAALAADPELAPDVTADGLVLLDAEGTAVASTSDLVAWDDSTTDSTGMPDETVPLEVDLAATGTTGTGEERVTVHELTVTPPEGFLTGDDVEYPVVIDPQIDRLTQVQDTWVRADINGGNGSDMKLLVGKTPTSNNNAARSFLHFNTSPFNGRQVARAELGLYQYYAASCSPKTMYVHSVNGTWTEGNMAWNTQPAVHSTGFATATANRGGANCTGPDSGFGYTTVDITPIARDWADGARINRGVSLTAPAAGDPTFERRFCSMNTSTAFNVCNIASHKPYLKVTYNAPPSYTSIPVFPLGSGRDWNGVYNVSTGRPTFKVASLDDDGTRMNNYVEVRPSASSSTVSASCVTPLARSGQTVECRLDNSLTNGQSYAVRARAYDDAGAEGPWSGWKPFRVNNVAPSAPSAKNCGPFQHNTWYENNLPANHTTCAITSANVAEYRWQINGKTVPGSLPSSGGTGSLLVPSIPAVGWTHITGQAFSTAGVPGPLVTYAFGTGPAGLNEPVTDTRSSTTFPIQATAPTGANKAIVQWRLAPENEGDTTTGWKDATKVNLAGSGSAWNGTDGLTAAGGTTGISQTPRVLWDARSETGIDLDALVQVRVRFQYPSGTPKDSSFQNVHVVKSAFGGNFPVENVGPVATALTTGEISIGGPDIEIPGYGETLSIGRQHLSMAGETTGPQSVFGPGWVANFAGPDYGVSGYTINDRTGLDGTIQLSSDGETYVYAHHTGTHGDQQEGPYLGIGEAAYLGDKVTLRKVTDSAIPADPTIPPNPNGPSAESVVTHRLTVVDEDKTVTVFKRITTGTSSHAWVAESVTAPETNSTTRYVYNADGTLAWMIAPSPSGVTCNVGTFTPGCRALEFLYTGTGTGVSGTKRLTEAKLWIYDPKTVSSGSNAGLPDPATAGMVAVSVARYEYDFAHRLTGFWDPRLNNEQGADGAAATPLKTTFEYKSAATTPAGMTLLSQITQPDMEPWNLNYHDTTTVTADKPLEGRLRTVTRNHAQGVTSQAPATWQIFYSRDVPRYGNGMPDLRPEATAVWGQPTDAAPYGAAAVFGPDRNISGSVPSAADWPSANLSYFDQKGQTTNTAAYGAGQWLVETTRYDATGNIIWVLDAEGRSLALAAGEDAASAMPASASADAVQDARLVAGQGPAESLASHTFYNATGTRIEATLSPTRDVVLSDGSTRSGRTLVETMYDDEAPADLVPGRPADAPTNGYDLKVVETTSVVSGTSTYPLPASSSSANVQVADAVEVRYQYNKLVTTDGDGWALQTPTRVLMRDTTSIVDSNGSLIPGSWATTLTRFDSEGKTIETRGPGAVAAGATQSTTTDPRVVQTIYYTADASAALTQCQNRPAWAGEVCVIRPAGSAGGAPPVETTRGYSMLLSPTRVEKTSGSTTQLTVAQFDRKQRPVRNTTTIGNEVTAQTTTYTPAGLVSTVSDGTTTRATTYDNWGRVVSQTDGTGNSSATSYDAAGRVATFSDGKATYSYTYDGKDALGRDERRGLVTAVDTGAVDGNSDLTSAAYNSDGKPILQTYPGGYTSETTYNTNGDTTSMTYSRKTSGGSTLPILAFTQNHDADGRVRRSTGPTGSTGYSYDDRDRLRSVTQTTSGSNCVIRNYEFTPDSNRAKLRQINHLDSGCATPGDITTTTSTFNGADYLTGSTTTTNSSSAATSTASGYGYDPLGRTVTVPRDHTDQANVASAGNLTIGYHPTDMVKSLTQTVPNSGSGGGTSVRHQDFSLNASGQISKITTSNDGAAVVEATHHYGSNDDSPAWTQSRVRPNGTTAWTEGWTRNIKDATGDFTMTQDHQGKLTLNLTNPHGDIVSTVDLNLDDSANSGTLSEYSTYNEYGSPETGSATSGRYGWLGQHQREGRGIVAGLTTMGARLYNPITGRFLSLDPIRGGNDNAFMYPADPVNQTDLTGERCSRRKFWRCGRAITSGMLGYAGNRFHRSIRYGWRNRGTIAYWNVLIIGTVSTGFVCSKAAFLAVPCFAAGGGATNAAAVRARDFMNGKKTSKRKLRNAFWNGAALGALGGGGQWLRSSRWWRR